MAGLFRVGFRRLIDHRHGEFIVIRGAHNQLDIFELIAFAERKGLSIILEAFGLLNEFGFGTIGFDEHLCMRITQGAFHTVNNAEAGDMPQDETLLCVQTSTFGSGSVSQFWALCLCVGNV
jgi:hypothetical protein